jgi:hypothetical protein
MTFVMADPTPDKSPAGKPIGGKAAAPGGPKPQSGVAKAPALPPKPGPAGGKPAAGGAGGGKAAPREGGDFKVIRSAPAPEGGSSTPLLIGGAVVALAIGGYFVIGRRPSGPVTPPTATEVATVTEDTGPDAMPDGIWDIFRDRQAFIEGEGRLADALKEALEKEKEYPTSRRLKGRLEELRAKLAAGAPTTETTEGPEALVAQAETALTRNNLADAMTKLDDVLSRDGLPDALAGRAHFLRALVYLKDGNALSAANDVEDAEARGFDKQKCDDLREQIASSQPR